MGFKNGDMVNVVDAPGFCDFTAKVLLVVNDLPWIDRTLAVVEDEDGSPYVVPAASLEDAAANFMATPDALI